MVVALRRLLFLCDGGLHEYEQEDFTILNKCWKVAFTDFRLYLGEELPCFKVK